MQENGQKPRRHEDADLAFYVQVFKDFHLALNCLISLRRHYVGSRVILISDGDDDPRYVELAKRFNAEYTAGERLYRVQCGGRMVHRMISAYLAGPGHFLLKIDTDTRIHRRFKYLPEGLMLFGTLEWETECFRVKLDFPNIQGGFIGFTRPAASAIYESGILLSEDLIDFRNTYANAMDVLLRAEKKELISTDFLIRYVCKELNIPMVAFPEVQSRWRANIRPGGEGYAVTHPHKSNRPGFVLRMTHWAKKFHCALMRMKVRLGMM